MAIKIAISLTALSLIQIGMAEVWDRKGSAPTVGQDRQAHYLLSLTTAALPPDGSGVAWWLAWCGGRWFSITKERSIKPKPSLFVELGAFAHQRETSARFRHQRNLQAFFVTFCLFAF